MKNPTPRGFTLIEMLVALLILGIMSALGYGTYRTARLSAERTEEALARSREIEFGVRMIVMDFSQMAPRPVRDPLGQTRLPALQGSPGNGTGAGADGPSSSGSAASGMSFNSSFGSGSSTSAATAVTPLADLTRSGWSNTAGQQRGTLQRVSYSLNKDVVTRSYQSALDNAQGTQPVVQNLLTGVKTVQLRYLDGNQAWQNSWPPATLAQPANGYTRPVAVEITIDFKDWGRIRRLIEVAG